MLAVYMILAGWPVAGCLAVRPLPSSHPCEYDPNFTKNIIRLLYQSLTVSHLDLKKNHEYNGVMWAVLGSH